MAEIAARPLSPDYASETDALSPAASPEPLEVSTDAEVKKLSVEVVEEPTGQPKKPRVQYPKLNAAALLNPERGLPKLMELFETRKWQGRGYEANNLNYLLFHLERWAKQLYPRWAATETIERVEELGKKREIKVFAKKIFEDTPTGMGINSDGLPAFVLGEEGNDDGETLPMNRKLRGFHGDREDDDADDDVFALLNQAMNGAAQADEGDDADLFDNSFANTNAPLKKPTRKLSDEEDDPDEDEFALLNQAMGMDVPTNSPSNHSADADFPIDATDKMAPTLNSKSKSQQKEDESDDDPFGLLKEPTDETW